MLLPRPPRQVAETLVPLVLQPPPSSGGGGGDAGEGPQQQRPQLLHGSQGHQADGEGGEGGGAGSLPEAVLAELRDAGVEVVGWVLPMHIHIAADQETWYKEPAWPGVGEAGVEVDGWTKGQSMTAGIEVGYGATVVN